MKQVVRELINESWIQRFGERRFDHEQFANVLVGQAIVALKDLRGYSGVGSDGNPYDTPSWNAALEAAEQVIKDRLLEEED